MAAYSRELLVSVGISKYLEAGLFKDQAAEAAYIKLHTDFYAKVGRDKYREYASVTPEAIRTYKQNYGDLLLDLS